MAASKESAAWGIMILHQEVTGQFYCKLLLSSEIAKAEAISVKLVK